MNKTIFLILLLLCQPLFAQVGINNTNPQAELDITASNAVTPNNNDGFLFTEVNAFPAINPTAAQDGMIIYLRTPLFGDGYYYWDNANTTWSLIPTSKWKSNLNGAGEPVLNAIEPEVSGNKVSVSDTGEVGVFTDNPTSELEVIGSRVDVTGLKSELLVENTADEVELDMIPSNPTDKFTIVTHSDGINGMSIQENNVDVFNIDNLGQVTIEDFSLANNPNMKYAANVYVDNNGKLELNYLDLFVNATPEGPDFLTSQTIETELDDTEIISDPLYTFTVVANYNLLIEISYYLDFIATQVDDITEGPDANHTSGLFGAFIEVVSNDNYAYNSMNYTGEEDEAYRGSYHLKGHDYIPLASGSTYTINLRAFIHSPLDNSEGWRAVFGSTVGNSRLQILKRL